MFDFEKSKKSSYYSVEVLFKKYFSVDNEQLRIKEAGALFIRPWAQTQLEI